MVLLRLFYHEAKGLDTLFPGTWRVLRLGGGFRTRAGLWYTAFEWKFPNIRTFRLKLPEQRRGMIRCQTEKLSGRGSYTIGPIPPMPPRSWRRSCRSSMPTWPARDWTEPPRRLTGATPSPLHSFSSYSYLRCWEPSLMLPIPSGPSSVFSPIWVSSPPSSSSSSARGTGCGPPCSFSWAPWPSPGGISFMMPF